MKVTQEFTININTPAVSIPLLSSSIQNIIVVDQLNSLLSYEIRNNELMISTLNATSVTIEYDTAGFTTQEGPIWTISLNSTSPVTAFLPEGSTIIFLNTVPSAITTDRGKNVLVMPKGILEFSYILPLSIPENSLPLVDPEPKPEVIPTENSKTNEQTPLQLNSQIFQIIPLLAVISFIIIIVVMVFKRRNDDNKVDEQPKLRHDDLEILKFIEESEGRVLELNIRKKFLLPKSSSWRMIRRLERLGYVKVTKVGVQNEVELLKRHS